MRKLTVMNPTILQSSEKYILMDLYGDILCSSDYTDLTIQGLSQILKYPLLTPIYRIFVLNQDESVNYQISNYDIIKDGISFSENYSNGERKSISLKLINDKGNYTPDVNKIWYNTKFKYEMGIRYNNNDYYFDRGVYVLSNFSYSFGNSHKEITYQLKDKFYLFSGNTGVLETGYEVQRGTNAKELIESILNMSTADGYVFDTQPLVIDSSLSNFKTQNTIRIEEGSKLSDLFESLAIQMSAEYYYNNAGNFCVYPIDETLNDVDKPIIWTYNKEDLTEMQFDGEEDIVNVIKVVGTNINNKIYTAIAKNENLNSPICVQRVKERKSSPINNENIWSDDQAQQLAQYELRKKSFITIKSTYNIPINPILAVNNVIEIIFEDSFNKVINNYKNKYIINSISHTSGQEFMTIEISNIEELPFLGQVKR